VDPYVWFLISRSGPVVCDEAGYYERLIIVKRRGRIKKMRKYGKGKA
jgi:hypothetical protein